MSFSTGKPKIKTLDTSRHSRRGGFGKDKLPSAEVRQHCVSVRLNKAELTVLDSKRSSYRRGEWLRMAALHQLAPVYPEINKEAWCELARSAANLNQIAKHLNTLLRYNTGRRIPAKCSNTVAGPKICDVRG